MVDVSRTNNSDIPFFVLSFDSLSVHYKGLFYDLTISKRDYEPSSIIPD
jgi:hypothetical protein